MIRSTLSRPAAPRSRTAERMVALLLLSALVDMTAMSAPGRAAPGDPPAVEIHDDSDWLELSASGRALRWERRRVVVCNRPGRASEELRYEALFEGFGRRPRSARVTRISARGRRQIWTLDQFTVGPYLAQGAFISDSKLHVLPLEPLAAGDTLLLESVESLDPFLGFPLLRLGSQEFPTRRRRLEVRIPRELGPKWALFNGAPEPLQSADGGVDRLVWDVGPTAPLRLDNWTPAAVDLLPTVSLGVMRMAWGPSATWEEVAGSYTHELDRRLDAPREAMGAPLRTAAAGDAGLDAHLRRIQDGVRYVAIALGPGGLIPHSPAEVERRLFGDCKDMALLLRSRLRDAGIEAALALVNTLPPAPGQIDPLPTLLAFNHAVVYVAGDSGGTWLDPTDRFGTPESPRSDIQGSPALVLSGPHVGYRRIPRLTADRNRVDSHLTLTPRAEGRWLLDARLQISGSPAIELKHRWSEARPVRPGDRVVLPSSLLPQSSTGVAEDSLEVTDVGSNALALRGPLACRLRTADLAGRKIVALPWKGAPGSLLELPQLPRSLPLEFERSRSYTDTLTIEGGLDYFELPATGDWSEAGPQTTARGSVRQHGRDLVVTRTVIVDAGWRTTEAQPALVTFVEALKRHNTLTLKDTPR